MDLPLSEARENARAASDAPASARIGLPVSFKNISKRFGATPAVDKVITEQVDRLARFAVAGRPE